MKVAIPFAQYLEPLQRLHSIGLKLKSKDLIGRRHVPVVRERMARSRNRLYLRSERFLALLPFYRAKKILFSEMPQWTEDIKAGFRHLSHQVEFGSITDASFQQYDLVVPLSLSALDEARRYSSLKKTALPVPSAESVHLCDDKYKFNQTLIESGFGRYIPRMDNGLVLKPPYILKKRIGWWGNGCYVIRNHEDETAQAEHINDPAFFARKSYAGQWNSPRTFCLRTAES